MAVVLLKLRRLVLLVPLLAAAGCGSIFLYPNKHIYVHPSEVGIHAEDIFFPARDGVRLHAWWMPAEGNEKGAVLFVHGNAENLTSHVRSVYWLPHEGWSVLLLDYRGYGMSDGDPDVRSCIEDTQDAIEFLGQRRKKFVLFGQSIGAAFATNAAVPERYRSRLESIVLDSGISSYPKIVRDKLSAFWITWALQYPLTMFMTSRYDPIDQISKLEGTPLLIMHGGSDPIVPAYHSELLFRAAREPKQFLFLPEAGHIGMLENPVVRQYFLDFLDTGAPKSSGTTDTALPS